ncbi:MAG TPA: VWA domain-containing protein [Thermoanaerobaculia bacterium]|jgi:VWFA-related protein
MRRFVSLAAVLLAASLLYAQQFGDAVQVSVVEVPVTVVDRSGNAVADLTKPDFELFDDGRKVPIEYFERVDMNRVSEESAREHVPPPRVATRHFLLMFDLANSSPGSISRASEAAKQFIDSGLRERDLVAVAVFTAESGARMITSFTNNRVLLENAVTTLGDPKYFKVADPLMISAVTSGGGDVATGGGRGGGSRAAIDAAAIDGAAELNRMNQNQADNEARQRLRIQFSNFGTVARMLDRVPGQKQVILLSEGFDARLVQGRENLGFETTNGESDMVLSGEAYNVNNDNRYGNNSANNDVADMARLFRRSDVVLHAIDIKGLRAVGENYGAKSVESLALITRPTGGTVFKNANDLGANFARMLKQQEIVYVLGFTARSTGKPGKFHELKVKAARGTANHRAGYYEAGSKLTDLERTLSLAEILITDAPMHDVPVAVSATPLPGPNGRARVPVLVEIPGSTLLEGVTGNSATANLYLYAFDDKNQVVDFLQQRIALDLTKSGNAVRSTGVRYLGTLRLAPGSYALKALVRVEETARAGFLRTSVDVPAFDKATALPPVIFTEPANWVMLVGPKRGDEYAYPFTAGETTYIPKADASLSANGEYKLALFLFGMPLENLQIEPLVVSNNGDSMTPNLKLLGRTAADERGGTKLLFTFKPQGLAAGAHELRFTVKAKDGAQSVVTMPFQIL